MCEDAERLINAWSERQARRTPMLFSLIIGAAIATPRSPVSFRYCRAVVAGPTLRLLISCGYRGPASLMKCGSSTHAARLKSRGDTRPIFHGQRILLSVIPMSALGQERTFAMLSFAPLVPRVA